MKSMRLKINRSIIVDQVASFLLSTKQVPYKSEITNIQFSELFGVSDVEYVTIDVFFKEEEVELIHYGDGT